MKTITKAKLLAAGLILVFGAGTVQAADPTLFPEDTPTVVYGDKRQEFGAGWYLRGDVAWSRQKAPELFADTNFGPQRQLNLFSAGTGGGYKFNNWFRMDGTLDWMAPRNVSSVSNNFNCPINSRGLTQDVIDPVTLAVIRTVEVGHFAVLNQCNAVQRAKLQSGVMLANGYFDLGTWSGVTPYVGAGVGVAYGKVNGNYNWIDSASKLPYSATLAQVGTFPTTWVLGNGAVNPTQYNFGPQNPARSIHRTQFNFAFALMTGFAVAVSKNAQMDFGYRFLNTGKWGDSNTATTAHDFRVGFRYAID